ncbi:MAG: hypothetical protein RL349_1385 [Bacteroidota bacterium]|jgi:hypothetical protein
MNVVYKHTIRFVIFAFLQALVFNQLNIGFGIHLMIQPLFIMLLPFELAVIPMMGIAFLMGLVIDIVSNTYGLNTSSLVLMAYLRPILFKFYGPREGYDPLKEPTSQDMGANWFTVVYGILLGLHTFWFFLLEIFELGRIGFIFQKTIFSGVLSFLLALLIQSFILNSKQKK